MIGELAIHVDLSLDLTKTVIKDLMGIKVKFKIGEFPMSTTLYSKQELSDLIMEITSWANQELGYTFEEDQGTMEELMR